LKNAKIANYFVEKTKNPSEMQKTIYESWLNAKW
jgi:hypothetical protein